MRTSAVAYSERYHPECRLLYSEAINTCFSESKGSFHNVCVTEGLAGLYRNMYRRFAVAYFHVLAI
jgi:hypothetical protein